MCANLNRWDVIKAQTTLRAIYEQKFPGLVSALADVADENLWSPQLVDIAAHEYDVADTKLLIVGKQPQTWCDKWNSLEKEADHAVRELLICYRDFNLGEGKRNTPFWQYAHKLYKHLNPNGPDHGFIWSNLVRMDRWNKKDKEGYPGWKIEERLIKSFDVLGCEVELAKPDVVVFFTGHDYDVCIEANFPGKQVSAVPGSDFDCKWLSFVRHDRLPERSYRTYHPGYLNRTGKGNSVLEAILELTLQK